MTNHPQGGLIIYLTNYPGVPITRLVPNLSQFYFPTTRKRNPMECVFKIEEGVLTETRNVPDDVTTLTLPNSVTTIVAGALQCGRVVTLTLPDSVTSVEEYAFWGLIHLQTLIVPYHFRDVSSLRILIRRRA